MNSRQRVIAAVNRQPVDRVPVDLGGMKASGISIFAYNRLRRSLGLAGGTGRVQDPRFMIALVDEDARKRLGIDVMPLDIENARWWRGREPWTERRLFDGSRALFPPGVRIHEEPGGDWVLLDPDGTPGPYRMPRGGYYFDDTAFDRGVGDFDPGDFQPDRSVPDEDLEALAAYSRHLHENTGYALLGWGHGVCFLGLSLITDRRNNVTLGRPSDWMAMLLTEPETCHEMMGRSVDASISCLEQVRQAVGDRCFAWGIAADDAGTQRGEFISPDLWASMIKPHYARLCSWIHENTTWKTFLHCCGSIAGLVPHFIEAGVDILNPVQTSAAGMDPERLKREFGDRIVFWGGGCDTQRVLGSAGPEEVREQVRERMAIFRPGGGYVFNQVHNIQADVPPENIVAMFDAAREFGAG